MAFVVAILFGAIVGYIFGSRIKPNQVLAAALEELKAKGQNLLEDSRQGVYTTIVTDNQKSSELVVEVKELATTTAGQVKVQYLSAFYKNPDFRTRKADALLQEVHGLLGEYLPASEIEWYDSKTRQQNLQEFLALLASAQQKNIERK